MKFVGLHRASSESWQAGAALAAAHSVIVLAMILLAARGSHDAQWGLIFLPLALLDLPVAVLAYPLALGLARALKRLGVLPPFDPIFLGVAVANGLVGGAFYLILPPAISAHKRFRRGHASGSV
jgi:hypothetical protein